MNTRTDFIERDISICRVVDRESHIHYIALDVDPFLALARQQRKAPEIAHLSMLEQSAVLGLLWGFGEGSRQCNSLH